MATVATLWTCSSPTWVSSTQITCTTPAGGGTELDVVVTVAGQSNSAGNGLFNYGVPEVTSVVPSKGDTAGGTLIVKGKGFGHNASSTRSITVGGVAGAATARRRACMRQHQGQPWAWRVDRWRERAASVGTRHCGW